MTSALLGMVIPDLLGVPGPTWMIASATFSTYFGGPGLDVVVTAPRPFAVGRGFFTLAGRKLDTDALKAPLRSHPWAYRFWRAAHGNTHRSTCRSS